MTRKPQALCQVKNLVILPKRVLRFEGPQPYICHKRKVLKVKSELEVEGSKLYRVRVNSQTWHVQLEA